MQYEFTIWDIVLAMALLRKTQFTSKLILQVQAPQLQFELPVSRMYRCFDNSKVMLTQHKKADFSNYSKCKNAQKTSNYIMV